MGSVKHLRIRLWSSATFMQRKNTFLPVSKVSTKELKDFFTNENDSSLEKNESIPNQDVPSHEKFSNASLNIYILLLGS